MTTASAETSRDAGPARCGCCGRSLPTERLVELGSTPDVYICDRCALWAARRSSRLPVVRLDPRDLVRWLRRLTSTSSGPFARAIPILPSGNLDRTAKAVGMVEVQRHEGYLLMQAGPVEVHFSTPARSPVGTPTPGEAFIHVPDAGMLWKQLKSRGSRRLGTGGGPAVGCESSRSANPTATRSASAAPSHATDTRHCRPGHRGCERVTGIEPAWPAWKAGALPLSYTRV